MCVCVCVCGHAEGSAVGAGYESGILVFKLSKVGQFQVMTRRRVRPQEWAAEKTNGRSLEWRSLEAGDGHCPWGQSSHPTRAGENHCTKVRCLGPHGGGGEGLDDDISLIHLHLFIQEILSTCFAFTGNQADRGLSLTYSAISKDHAGLHFPRPFPGGGKGGALLEPWPQGLLHRHRGLWSGHTSSPH